VLKWKGILETQLGYRELMSYGFLMVAFVPEWGIWHVGISIAVNVNS
jgi:hypothetical protein